MKKKQDFFPFGINPMGRVTFSLLPREGVGGGKKTGISEASGDAKRHDNIIASATDDDDILKKVFELVALAPSVHFVATQEWIAAILAISEKKSFLTFAAKMAADKTKEGAYIDDILTLIRHANYCSKNTKEQEKYRKKMAEIAHYDYFTSFFKYTGHSSITGYHMSLEREEE